MARPARADRERGKTLTLHFENDVLVRWDGDYFPEQDVELAKKIRGHQNPIDAFVVGPQLHMLEGSVRVTPLKIEMDVAAGQFYGEFRWENSWEAEAHVREYGPQADPVCWMLIGYASGYTSYCYSNS